MCEAAHTKDTLFLLLLTIQVMRDVSHSIMQTKSRKNWQSLVQRVFQPKDQILTQIGKTESKLGRMDADLGPTLGGEKPIWRKETHFASQRDYFL